MRASSYRRVRRMNCSIKPIRTRCGHPESSSRCHVSSSVITFSGSPASRMFLFRASSRAILGGGGTPPRGGGSGARVARAVERVLCGEAPESFAEGRPAHAEARGQVTLIQPFAGGEPAVHDHFPKRGHERLTDVGPVDRPGEILHTAYCIQSDDGNLLIPPCRPRGKQVG